MSTSWESGGPAHARPALPPELDPRGGRRRHARKGGRRHSAVVVTKVLAALLSAFLVVTIGYLWKTYRDLDNDVSRLKIDSLGGSRDANGKTTGPDIDGKDQNLLLVGNDDRSDMSKAEQKLLHTGDAASLSTDTMMIIHVPADGSKATLISLPRDSYVSIPGYGKNKLNSAYSSAYNNASGDTNAKRAAGASLLVKTVQNLTGLSIDHYVQVGLIGFYRIANAIGGVTVTLCKAVDDTHAHNVATGQDGGSGFKMSAGKHKLNGVEALEFVRQRHNLPNGDIDRTARQRYFLAAAFRQVASAGTLVNPSRLNALVSAVDRSLYIDSGLKVIDLARQMSNLSANNIIGKSIPFERYWNDSPVGSVEVVDPAKVQAFVENLINTDPQAYAKAKTVDPKTVSVSVVNASSANGAATAAAKTLAQAGFSSSVGTDATPQSSTVIEYPPGMEAQAKTLAQYVPGAKAQGDGGVKGVTLLLGTDNRTARSTPTATGSSSSPTGSSAASSSKVKTKTAIDSGCIN